MRIVIVPGTGWGAGAEAVGRRVAQAWDEASGRDELRVVLLSDGGPGFAEAVRAAPGADGSALYLDASHAPSAGAANVTTASSYELGRMLAAARLTGSERVVLGLGPPASTPWADGGAGLLAGLGEERSSALTGGGRGLDGIVAGDVPDLQVWRAVLVRQRVEVATRSLDPLLGPRGLSAALLAAGRIEAAEASGLERRLGDLAIAVAGAARPGLAGQNLLLGTDGTAPARARDLAARPGAGAGGGAGFVLGLLGADLVPGLEVTAALAGLDEALDDADLVLVVPPRVDAAEMHDGVTPFLAARAMDRGLPVVVLTGECQAGRREWAAAGVSAVYEPGAGPVGGPADREAIVGAVGGVTRTWSPRR